MNYDKIADDYEAWGHKAITDWELGHKNVAKLLGSIEKKNILDYGCGNGKFSKYLFKLGAKVVGVDISESQLEIAKKTSENIHYFLDTDPIIGSQYREFFDAAVMIFVLCEISSRETMEAVLKRVHGLLKPGSSLVVLNPNWDKSNGKNFLTHEMKYEPELKLGGSVTTILKGNPPIHIPDFYWSKEVYLESLKTAGFDNFTIHEPLAADDGTPWKDEKFYPPFLIIQAQKV